MLYRISDVCCLVVYHLVRYRREAVLENLRNSFPDQTRAELETISKRFYSHFSDLIIESVKGCSISKAEILRRHGYSNIEVLEKFHAQGRNVTLIGGHFGNWEWAALSLPLVSKFKTHAIYRTLTNSFMDRVAKRSRERHGMKLVSTKEVAGALQQRGDSPSLMSYIADQSPAQHGKYVWARFMNQDAASFNGFELYAKKYDTPVVYVTFDKIKRGHYLGTFYVLTEEPRKTKEGEILQAYINTLERVIRAKPEHWLWSHRRWKIKRPQASISPQELHHPR